MRSAGDFLDRGIRQRAEMLRDLDHALWRLLPTQATNRCHCAGVHHGVLVVIAETGVIATLIRFHQQTILSGLGNYISDRLKTVPLKVRVKVASLPEGLKTPTRSPIPPGQAADTLEAAARIVSDQDLSRSLKRLAQRAVKRH